MNEIEAHLKAIFRSQLDHLESGPLPPQIDRRARRNRAAMIVVSAVASVALIASGLAVVSALTSQRPGEGTTGPAVSPHPITIRSNGRLTYSDGNELRSVRPDGSGDQVIPTPDGNPWSHSWSPDGTKLGVVLFPPSEGPRTIWVMNPDGSEPLQVASADNVSVPSWSPDGETIAYSASNGAQTSIHLVGADGTNDRVIHIEGAEGTFAIFSATFSPDGTQILFDRGTDSGFDIFVMDVDGTDVRQLTTTGSDYNPSWSPDGTQIAFSREDDSKADADTVVTSDIFVMNADGSNVHRLTETRPRSTDFNPVWSPDGTKIAYLAGVTGGPGALVVMNEDGSDPEVLVDKDVLGLSWRASDPI